MLTQEWWSPEKPRALRTPSGRVYAAISQAENFTLTTAGGVTVTLETHGLRLHTTPKPGELPVYPRGGLLFAGVLQTGGGTGLHWTALDGPQLRVTPPTDPRVQFASSPTADIACAELSLAPIPTDLVVPDHALRGRGPIAVAASPGGPIVLTLNLKRNINVRLLTRTGPHAFIAWPIDDGALADSAVIGWVRGDLVHDPVPTRGSSVEGSAGGMSGTSDWGGCSKEHPIFADAGRGPEPVGEILVGTRVKKGPRRGALITVTIEGPSIQMVPPAIKPRAGTTFLLAPDDATDCAR